MLLQERSGNTRIQHRNTFRVASDLEGFQIFFLTINILTVGESINSDDPVESCFVTHIKVCELTWSRAI